MVSHRLSRIFILVCGLLAFAGLFHTLQYVSAPRKSVVADTEGPWSRGDGEQAAATGSYAANATATWPASDEGDGGLLRAAMVALVRNSEMDGIRSTIRQVDDRFNRDYGYPYILLNDVDFTEEFMEKVQAITRAKVYFGKLPASHWGLSDYVTEDKVKAALEQNKDRYLYGGSYSYRLMCRYQSGFIHKHPLLKNLDWYWRIEPGVKYYCGMSYDPFRYMRDNNMVYGYTIAPTEKQLTVETLWNTTRQWMLENPDLLPDSSFVRWAINEKSQYNMCHFWSNFEIVNLAFYRSKAYESYFQHLDRAGGFFYERWGDAPVHSIAAAMLLRKDQIHWFEDVGYWHPELSRNCICDAKQTFMYNSKCQRRFNEVDNISRDQALELARLPDR
ncbi:alpha 1,2-mannosyltransferase 2.4.1 [Coemansia sp. RSA 2322]|nr:alpha 1,2-mannosyltransferase 2.4.1 [Coemansia sp. RSA 2322]